jgi:hypothetical protein
MSKATQTKKQLINSLDSFFLTKATGVDPEVRELLEAMCTTAENLIHLCEKVSSSKYDDFDRLMLSSLSHVFAQIFEPIDWATKEWYKR